MSWFRSGSLGGGGAQYAPVLFLVSCMTVPVVVTMRQLFQVDWAGSTFKALMALGLVLLAPQALRAIAGIRHRWLILGLAVIAYGLVLTVLSFTSGNVAVSAFVPHLFAFTALLLFAAGYDDSIGLKAIELFHRFRWWLISLDVVALLVYRWNPVGADSYAGFESTAIMPTFILALRQRRYGMILLHLGLFIAHSKRAITFAAFLMVIFAIAQLAGRLSWPKRLAIIGTLVVSLAAGGLALRSMVTPGGETSRGLSLAYTLMEGDLTVDGSLEEKASEIVLAYRKMMRSDMDWALGVGFGWFYDVRLEFSESDEYTRRHYIHMTPAFIHMSLGVPGLLMYFYLFYRAARAAMSVVPHYAFWGYFALFSLIVGLSVLNIFTEPLVAFAIGATLGADAIRKGYRFVFLPATAVRASA